MDVKTDRFTLFVHSMYFLLKTESIFSTKYKYMWKERYKVKAKHNPATSLVSILDVLPSVAYLKLQKRTILSLLFTKNKVKGITV